MAKNKTETAKQGPAGFNCPNCNFFIEVSIESLLYGASLKCPGCHTEFNMNGSESKTALGFLQNLKVAKDNLDTIGD